jgi:hypothetical protein
MPMRRDTRIRDPTASTTLRTPDAAYPGRRHKEAERKIRSAAVGRKNYYGSGSVWSGQLAAMMFSILQTLELHGICPRKWMTRYLSACAELRGRVPEDFSRFLPWNLTEEERAALSAGRETRDTS